MNDIVSPDRLKPADFASDQEVRWCPGCGDYAILKAVQRTLADVGANPDETVFVSGIGCSSRFPYYLSTYGFHTIHGRAPAVATGIKLANPDLDVWITTGDGDGLSIGGNHTLHILRRNVDVQILLFNNEIYGLTKGQYSPTSHAGTRSPSTPLGSLETPLSAAAFALGAGGRFVARAIDTDKRLVDTLTRAYQHRGASFLEIFQNCIVYNDNVFSTFTAKDAAPDRQIHVQHGKPLRFGRENALGLRLNPRTLSLEVIQPGTDSVEDNDVLIHDETNRTLAGLLAAMSPPELPMAIGVLYCAADEPFEKRVFGDRSAAMRSPTTASALNAMIRRGHTWTVGD